MIMNIGFYRGFGRAECDKSSGLCDRDKMLGDQVMGASWVKVTCHGGFEHCALCIGFYHL